MKIKTIEDLNMNISSIEDKVKEYQDELAQLMRVKETY
jgi:flagellar biosynthesis chaperone FliJ